MKTSLHSLLASTIRLRLSGLLTTLAFGLLASSASSQLLSTYDLNKAPGSASDAPQVVAYGGAASDDLGRYVVAGDINGDGIADLIIGARNADPLGRTDAGAVYVWFGKGSLAGTKDAAGTAPDLRIYGASASDLLTDGGALTVGDVNGDGTADLILGAVSADGPSEGRNVAGEAYIVYGRKSPAVFPATLDLAVQGSSGADVTFYGATAGDNLTGAGALTVGDVNGDGTADLLLGALNADGPSEGRSLAGEAYIVYGRKSPAVFPATLDLGVQGSSGADVTIYGATGSDTLTNGGALTVGDVNGDGTADLLLGATGADGPSEGRSAAGEAYIVYGRKSPAVFPATLDLAVQGSSGADVTLYGATAGDNLINGGALTVGDVNGDGTVDLLLGAPLADGPSDGRLGAGEAYIVYGRKSPAVFPATLDLGVQGSSGADVTLYGATVGDTLTRDGALTVGDVNGDGTADLLLGATGAGGPFDGRVVAGEAYIVYGRKSPAIFPATLDLALQGSSGADVTLYGATAFDNLTNGGALTAGDVNGDGTADLLLGALNADGPSEGRSAAGEAYIIYGRKSPAVFPATLDLGLQGSSGADVTIYGATANDQLTNGGALTVGDVNGDGTADLLLGAPFADGPSEGRFNAGEAYVLFGVPAAVAPTVTNITPASGSTLGGTVVTITGTDFTGVTAVTLGGTPATSFTFNSATQITATTPAHAAGAVSVDVTTPGGTNAANTLFTYIAPPVITNLFPPSGPTAGGTPVTITGLDFTGASSVTFDGIAATNVVVVNNTSITCDTPPHAGTGLVSVLITTPNGTNPANTAFTYLAPPTVTNVAPSSGPTVGSTVVTLTGTNFIGVTSVTFDGTLASYTVDSPTQITATTPPHISGPVSVIVTATGGTNAANTLFTYDAPTVSNVSPATGPIAGGTVVTISGTGFTGASAVTFDGFAASPFNVVSDSQITATTPAHAAGAVNVVVVAGGQSSTGGIGLFTYTAAASLLTTYDLNKTPGSASDAPQVVAYGAAAGDNLGRIVLAGDINGDGIADLIVGARAADPLGRTDAGAVYVWFGKGSLAGTKDAAGTAGTAPDLSIYGATAFDRLTDSGALTVGDVNGDGTADLLLGTDSGDGPSEGRFNAGEAYIVYGRKSPAVFPATLDLAVQGSSGADVTLYGATAVDQLTTGGALTVGDVNGDGTADLLLGANFADGPSEGRSLAGEAYIVYGRKSPAVFPATLDLAVQGSSGADVTLYGATADDQLTNGGALTVGDVNGDGTADLLLGALFADGPSNGRINAGEAYIVYGRKSPAVFPATLDLGVQGSSGADVTLYGATAVDQLTTGGALTVGDVNGDGTADLLLGALFADGPSNGRINAGEAYVVYGRKSPAVFPATLDLAVQGSSGADVTLYGATAIDFLTDSGALTVGDVNGDGTADLLLGADGADGPANGRNLAGEAYIVYGRKSPAVFPATLDLGVPGSSGADVTIYGASVNDRLTIFGALTVGDVNGDGTADLLLGTGGADGPAEGRSGAGEAYVLGVASATAPTVTTAAQSAVTATSAILGGNVTADGGASVTERGIVWGTSTGPTTADNKVQNGSGTGAFSGTVGSLPAGMTVFVRAYAINSVNTSYGSEISFTTPSNNADLSALTVTTATLNETFAAATITYTANVPNATSSVTVTPTAAQANATIQARVGLNAFASVTSGSPSASLPLAVGPNTIEVKVTAQDGTTIKTYTITVTRAAPPLAQLLSTYDLNKTPGSASDAPQVVAYGAVAGDDLGRTVLAGDINGDGIADLIVGAMMADPLGRTDAGAVYVWFGKGNLAGTKDAAGTAGTAPDLSIYGATASDGLTFDGALTVGDVNGDGTVDLLLGAEGADGPSEGRNAAGEAYIVYGRKSPAVFPATLDLGVPGSSGADVTLYGASGSDGLTFGGALTVGDVNGDGTVDLLLGALSADGPSDGRSAAGEAYIVYGRKSPAVFPATLDLGVPGITGADVTLYGATGSDLLTAGGALTVGDVNGDGTADLLLGARDADGPSDGRLNAGEAYIVYGRKSPAVFPATLDLAVQGSSGADVTLYGASARDFLTGGGALTVGDVNGDGTADLLLGAFFADGPAEGRDAAGEAYIVYGRKSPAVFPATLDLGVQGSSGADVTLYGATASDGLTANAALTVGDVNGDGTADLLLGANQADGPSEGRSAAGEAYVVYGRKSPAVFPATLDLGVQGSSGADVTLYGATASDDLTSGVALTVGDVNGDGTVDLVLVASGADGPSEGRLDAGEAYVLYGVAPAATAPTVTNVTPTSGSTLGGTSVTITGTGFTGATAVKFGGTAATSFTVVSDTEITAVLPAHAGGVVSVEVTTGGGTNAPNTLFSYIDYTVTTTATSVTVTDVSGQDDALSFYDDAGTDAVFEATGRSFSLNGGAAVNDSISLPYASLSGITQITINGGAGNDTIDINDFTAVPAFPGLTVNGGTGDDRVTFNGKITFANNRNLDVDLQNDDAAPGLDEIFFLGRVQVYATGSAVLRASHAIRFQNGSVGAEDGDIIIEANQQAVPNAAVGVELHGASIYGASANPITIKGRGSNYGIAAEAGTSIYSQGGDITLIGVADIGVFGGGAVDWTDSTIESVGPVVITGTHLGYLGSGVALHGNSGIDAYDADVTITGHGAPGEGDENLGVLIEESSSIDQQFGNGDITITGHGGVGTGATVGDRRHGIVLLGQLFNESGDINLTGVAGTSAAAGHSGIVVDTSTVFSGESLIDVTNGNVTLLGTHQGTGFGLDFDSSAGNVIVCYNAAYLRADRMRFADTMGGGGLVVDGGGEVTLSPLTSGHEVRIGAADTATELGLSEEELNRVVVGGHVIVESPFGNVSIASATAITATDAFDIVSGSTSGITFQAMGSLTVLGGEVHLFSGTDGIASLGSGSAVTTDSLFLTSDGQIGGDINGVPFPTTQDFRFTAGNISTLSAGAQSLFASGSVSIGDSDLSAGAGTIQLSGGTWSVSATGSILSAVEVSPAATLKGAGITSHLTLHGTLSPGASPGIINTGNFRPYPNSVVNIEIGGITPGNTASDHDQINVTGTVQFTGNPMPTLNLSTVNGFVPSVGQSFVIIANDGGDAVTGNFNGLPGGATISNFLGSSLSATITYAGGSGNDVVLTAVVPIPAPTVTSISPTSGSTAGGTSVTITGTGFTGATGATVGGVALSGVTVNATTITGTTGAHAAGAVDVAITGSPGGASTGGTGIYTYSAGPPPPQPLPGADANNSVATGASASDGTGATDGTKFDQLQRSGFIAENGTLVFLGYLKDGVGGVDATNFMGYWKHNGSSLTRIARQGFDAPETGATAAKFNILPLIPGINDDGQVTLFASLLQSTSSSPVTTAANDTGLWSELGGTGFQILIREDDVIPGLAGDPKVDTLGYGCFATAKTGASTGEAALIVGMKGSSTDTALLRASVTGPDVTAVGVIARENSPAPGTSENFNLMVPSYSGSVRMDAQGNVVFGGWTKPGNKLGIWYQDMATKTVSKTALVGETAAGTGGATFGLIDLPNMGGNGTYAFRGVLNMDGDNTANDKNDGIWKGTGNGVPTPILRRGDSNTNRPGLFGTAYTTTNPSIKAGNIYNGWLTNANHGAWLGWVDFGGDGINSFPTDGLGVYTDTSGTMTLLAVSGDAAPGIAGATFLFMDHPVCGGVEQVAFLATVTGGGVGVGTTDKGVWRTAPNGGALSLVLRIGDSLTVNVAGTPTSKQIANVDIPGSGYAEHIWETPVMDGAGRLLIYVTFTDGSSTQVLVR